MSEEKSTTEVPVAASEAVEEQKTVDEEADDGIPPLTDLALSNQDAQDERATTNNGNKMDWRDVELLDEDIDANVILVPKNRRGDFGSRDYLRNLEAATAPLDPKMGVPSHFVSTRDGETDAGN